MLAPCRRLRQTLATAVDATDEDGITGVLADARLLRFLGDPVFLRGSATVSHPFVVGVTILSSVALCWHGVPRPKTVARARHAVPLQLTRPISGRE